MGLDMYLHRHIFSFDHHTFDIKQNKDVKSKLEPTLFEKLLASSDSHNHSVSLDVIAIYWEKANAIHKWFVDNVQEGNDDCQTYDVSYSQLAVLKDLCLSVISNHDNEYSKGALPTQAGIFFGTTKINDTYYQIIKDTYQNLEKELELASELKKTSLDISYTYRASW